MCIWIKMVIGEILACNKKNKQCYQDPLMVELLLERKSRKSLLYNINNSPGKTKLYGGGKAYGKTENFIC